MMDAILSNLKQELNAKLLVLGIDSHKNSMVIGLARQTITQHLKDYTNAHTLQGTEELFKSKEPLEKNPLVQRMMIDYKNTLVSRLALMEKNSERVSNFIIPFLLSQVSNRINQDSSLLKKLVSQDGFFERLKFRSVLVLTMAML